MATNSLLFRFINRAVKYDAIKSFLLPPHPIKSFHRNGFILKRRIPIPQYSRLETADSIMRNVDPIHEEYLIVENTNQTTLPEIEVILKTYVEDVGEPGQRVFLDQMLAYELIVLGEAMYVTPENLTKMKILTESEIDKHSSLTAFKTMNMLKKKTLSVYMNMHEPWTIEPWNIRVNFRRAGVNILNDECIVLPEKSITGPCMDNEGKDFVVHVVINNCERVPVRCRLRHYTKIFHMKVILPPDHDCVPSDPIFPEQTDLLKSIPLPMFIENDDQGVSKTTPQRKQRKKF